MTAPIGLVPYVLTRWYWDPTITTRFYIPSSWHWAGFGVDSTNKTQQTFKTKLIKVIQATTRLSLLKRLPWESSHCLVRKPGRHMEGLGAVQPRCLVKPTLPTRHVSEWAFTWLPFPALLLPQLGRDELTHQALPLWWVSEQNRYCHCVKKLHLGDVCYTATGK